MNYSYLCATAEQRKVKNSYVAYIDKDLRHKMFLRDLFKKRFNRSKNTVDWQRFTKLRNEVNSFKHVKKHAFYTQKLDETRGDINGTWKVLNNAMGKRKSKSAKINSLKVHRKDISDSTAIANELLLFLCIQNAFKMKIHH